MLRFLFGSRGLRPDLSSPFGRKFLFCICSGWAIAEDWGPPHTYLTGRLAWSRRSTVGVGPTPYKWPLPELDLHLSRERATLAPLSRNSGVGHSGSWPPLHCGDLTNSHLRLLLVPHTLWGPHIWVWEGMPGDWRLWASSTCWSRAMGTTGADCSWVARATIPGPPPQPHGWVRLGLEVSRFPHFWGGDHGMCRGSLGCGVSGLFSSIFFSKSLNKKKHQKTLPDREASLIRKEYCRCGPHPPTSDFFQS